MLLARATLLLSSWVAAQDARDPAPSPPPLVAWWRTIELPGEPVAVQQNAAGRLVVLDERGRRLLFLDANGAVERSVPAEPEHGPLLRPTDFVLSADGGSWVADAGADALLRLDDTGRELQRIGGPGSAPGLLRRPAALCVQGERIHVADAGNRRVQVFRTDGTPLLCFGAFGDRPGEFRDPAGLAVADDGTIFVADRANHRVQAFTRDGEFLRSFGEWGAERGWFSHPHGLAWTDAGLFVTDSGNHRVQVVDREGRWQHGFGLHAQVPGEHEGKLHAPTAVFVSAAGDFAAVCEPWEQRVQLFRRGPAAAPPDPTASAGTVHLGPALALGGERAVGFDTETHELLVHLRSGNRTDLAQRAGSMGSKLGEMRDVRSVVLDATGERGVFVDAANQSLTEFEIGEGSGGAGVAGSVPATVRFLRGVDLRAVRASLEGELAATEWLPGRIRRSAEGFLLLEEATGSVLRFDSRLRCTGVARVFGRAHVVDFADWRAGQVLVDDAERRVLLQDSDGASLADLPIGGGEFPGWCDPCALAVLGDGGLCVVDRGRDQLVHLDPEGRFLGAIGGPGIGTGRFRRPAGIAVGAAGELCVVEETHHRAQWFTPGFEPDGMFGSRLYLMAARRADGAAHR